MMFTAFLSARSPSTALECHGRRDALENVLQARSGCSPPGESSEFSRPSQGQDRAGLARGCSWNREQLHS